MVSRSERISARFLVPNTFRKVVAASKRVEWLGKITNCGSLQHLKEEREREMGSKRQPDADCCAGPPRSALLSNFSSSSSGKELGTLTVHMNCSQVGWR